MPRSVGDVAGRYPQRGTPTALEQARAYAPWERCGGALRVISLNSPLAPPWRGKYYCTRRVDEQLKLREVKKSVRGHTASQTGSRVPPHWSADPFPAEGGPGGRCALWAGKGSCSV